MACTHAARRSAKPFHNCPRLLASEEDTSSGVKGYHINPSSASTRQTLKRPLFPTHYPDRNKVNFSVVKREKRSEKHATINPNFEKKNNFWLSIFPCPLLVGTKFRATSRSSFLSNAISIARGNERTNERTKSGENPFSPHLKTTQRKGRLFTDDDQKSPVLFHKRR